MLKIYTKTGDDGTTGLYQRGRVSKDSDVIEAIGAVDEFNSFVGALAAQVSLASLKLQILQIQNHLFDIGAALAAPLDSNAVSCLADSLLIETVESQIDTMQLDLEPIKQFILPGGTVAASTAHLCRASCRSAERRIVRYVRTLGQDEINSNYQTAEKIVAPQAATDVSVFKVMLQYLNRLSDYFFVVARYLNLKESEEDVFWQPAIKKQ